MVPLAIRPLLAVVALCWSPWSLALNWSQVFTPGTLLPLFGQHPLVRENLVGEALPAPFGLTPGYYAQQQDAVIHALQFERSGVEGMEAVALPPGLSSLLAPVLRPATAADNRHRLASLRLDAWLLPMLNVFYMQGRGRGVSLVAGEVANRAQTDLFRFPFELGVQTLGFTAVYGGRAWWLGLTGAKTRIDGHAGADMGFVLEPHMLAARLGSRLGSRWNLWLGASHLHMGEIRGSLRDLGWLQSAGPLADSAALISGPRDAGLVLDFSARLEARAHWLYFAGWAYTFSRHLSLNFEAGGDVAGGWLGTAELQWRGP